jgi:S-DNA-T family DNA segregation ATPase FtsK/SpoIIIE
MPKKKNNKNQKDFSQREKTSFFTLPEETKKLLFGILMFLLAIIFGLSFFGLSGQVGKLLMSIFMVLVGKTIFLFPLIFILAGFSFFYSKYKKFIYPLLLSATFFILGVAGTLEILKTGFHEGGYLGYIGSLFLNLFGFWVTQIIFLTMIFVSLIIFWQLLSPSFLKKAKEIAFEKEEIKEEKKSIVRRLFEKGPKLKLKEIEQESKIPPSFKRGEGELGDLKIKSIGEVKKFFYQPPPLNLLEGEKDVPSSGDIKINSAIIKKTLQNFGIPVEMCEVSVGPTVTQYTLKPAEGVKLSKITALSNDLALSLASHPIRIEAPIPGRPLVGVEVPNKLRAKVRLRDLISNQIFQKSTSNLAIILGRDVSGVPIYADLAKMPHLLVAGSTGAGKTIFLNSLLLSLLYRPPNNLNPYGGGPEILRFILIDPKRVEFPVYNDLPHLLCPVICDSQRAVNALKWVISEMERRFDFLSEVRARDISSYNEMAARKNEEPLPFIILVIDELADLMAARGKEVEGAVVRIAQMARAVGIHLVVATQRPSVEVITGLIKANITARVSFQVASQVDSRTILDAAGSEKLLGLGDLLFVSAEVAKPKRIQSPYISEKEVRRVVEHIKSKIKEQKSKISDEILAEGFNLPETIGTLSFQDLGEDPLYEEAKRVVIEARKASASLLQRRLRIGYARAARLIDMLEEKGVVGPADGAKPREILLKIQEENNQDDWKKV